MNTVLLKLPILEIPALEKEEVSISDKVLRQFFLHCAFFLCSVFYISAGASKAWFNNHQNKLSLWMIILSPRSFKLGSLFNL